MKKDKDFNFKEIFSDPRNKILLKFGLWAIFFLVFFLIASIGSNIENPDETTKTTTTTINFTQMKQNLLKQNIAIKYELLFADNTKIIIEGNIADNILTGTLENSTKTQKFKYNGTDIYEIKMNDEIKNNTLFSNFNPTYFLPSSLLNQINDLTPYISTNKDNKIYTYTIEGKNISLYLNNNAIEKAIILDNNITYTLYFN